jgi:prepilin-type N-terminal cleavage/methylation domain-containing protein
MRRAFTLLEMLAVVALLGILALAAAGAFRPETVGDLDGGVAAQRLAWNLEQARRRAISVGDNHVLTFQSSGGTLTGYTLQRRLPDTTLTSVDAPHFFPAHVTVTTATPSPEFTFEGAALAGYTFTVTTPHKSWTITVAQATGSIRIQ